MATAIIVLVLIWCVEVAVMLAPYHASRSQDR